MCWVGIEPDRMKKVEALDWDQTVSTLGDFADERQVPRRIGVRSIFFFGGSCVLCRILTAVMISNWDVETTVYSTTSL